MLTPLPEEGDVHDGGDFGGMSSGDEGRLGVFIREAHDSTQTAVRAAPKKNPPIHPPIDRSPLTSTTT